MTWTRQGFPEPVTAAREAEAAECPPGVLTALRAAQRAGWHALVTYAQGTRADGKGEPTLERVRVHFKQDEEGSDTKQKKYEDVPTGRFVISETLALRCAHDDGRRFFIVWRRDAPKIPLAPEEGTSGYKLDCGWTNRMEKVNTRTLKGFLADPQN